MSHVFVFSYVAATMVGLVALAVSVLGTVRSRVLSYALLVVFHGAFTAQVAALFVREYLYVNVPGFSFSAIMMTYRVAILMSLTCLAAIGLFYHRIFALARARLLDAIVVGLALFSAVAYLWPSAVTVQESEARFIRNMPVLVGVAAYVALFAYVLVTGAVGHKADRPRRELLLIWSTFAFGVVGFAESVAGLVGQLRNPAVVMRAGGDHLASTVPYVLFGGILLYYFGSFLISESRPRKLVSDEFVTRFGISAREREVIALLNEGLGNREIAEKLFVSLATVKSHVHSIYEKTGAKGRYALFRLTTPAQTMSA